MLARCRTLVLSLLGVSFAVPAYPCECVDLKPWEKFREAKYVYLGQVSDVAPSSQGGSLLTYRMKPLRVWKGPKRDFELTSGQTNCSRPLEGSGYYLVYADQDPSETSICGVTIPLCAARAEIAWLDRERRYPPTVVPGVDCDQQPR